MTKSIPGTPEPGGEWYRVSRTSARRDEKPCLEAVKFPTARFSEWYIELDGLSGLREFIRKYGVCVLGQDVDGHWFIEIYDDYRE